MKNRIEYCKKCEKYRGHYYYPDKLVCCGCGSEIENGRTLLQIRKTRIQRSL